MRSQYAVDIDNNPKNGISNSLGSSSSSMGSYQHDFFQGSNDFILTSNGAGDSIKRCIHRKLRYACSKKMLHRRLPILDWLPNYNMSFAFGDFMAGITVGLTLIPQGLAYSSIAGVPPQYGLYGSFLGCFFYILFGSCHTVAVGPTAMTAILISESIKGRGPDYAILLCFLTGIVQVLMGVLGLGFLIDFISGPVLSGFISSAAVVIVTTQVKDILGIPASGESFVKTWTDIVHNIGDTAPGDAIIGFTCLVVALGIRVLGKVKIKPPNKATPLNTLQILVNKTFWFLGIARNAILVVVCSSIGYYYCQQGKPPFHVTGYVPAGLPTIKLPPFSHTPDTNSTDSTQTESFFDMVHNLSSGLILVPVFGLLEDIIICKTFSQGKAVDATQEFIAIGLCNVASSFVQAFPGTGGLARSAINHSSGVKTTLGGLYTGSLVIVALLFLTPYCYYIPKATLAAIIIAAAIFMIEIRVLKPMWRAKKSDLVPGLATFVGCLMFPFQYGILIGVGINFMFIMYHAARPTISMERTRSEDGINYLLLTPDRCLIFPSVNYVRNLVNKYSIRQGIPVVMDCTHIYGADYTAATVIENLTRDFWNREQPLFFYNLKPSVSTMIDRLSPQDFFVFYNRREFDEMMKKWWMKRRSMCHGTSSSDGDGS